MANFEQVKGAYLRMNFEETDYRVYVEESGSGIPVMLQHTAGSDGRQYRHLMNDPQVTKEFRLIAYDLPYHGKSLPPLNTPWWETTYSLSRDFLMGFTLALAKELELNRPVFLGSSMGGHLAVDLAYYHPDKFRAVIGVEAALKTPNLENFNVMRYLTDNPKIGKETIGVTMYSAIAPNTPEKHRQEIGWEYNQGGPGIFAGDIDYYAFDHDLSGLAHKIDVTQCMVYLLTGEYDFATPPETTQLLADQIDGCRFSVMEGLGHFPMTENYERFREYLMPILREIKTSA